MLDDVTPDDVRRCFEIANRVAKSVWELRQVGAYRAKAPANVATDYVAVRNEFVALRASYERVCRAVPDYSTRLGHIKAENMLTVVWRLLEEASTVINDALDYPRIAPADQRIANVSARFGRLPDYYLADLIHVLDGEMAFTVLLVQLPPEKAEALSVDTKERLRRAYERRFPLDDAEKQAEPPTNGVEVVDAATNVAATVESDGPPWCMYFGDGELLVDGVGISIEDAEAVALEALIELRTCKLPELIATSGHAKAARLLKRITEKHPALKRHIKLPGRRGKGGYSTTIVKG